ncbi:MAG: hypothetical protein H6751_08505 [Candidatus Omnitrophica bacterium]|nr:hypothetical protein [Candidatus Omnitrophota bacterium]
MREPISPPSFRWGCVCLLVVLAPLFVWQFIRYRQSETTSGMYLVNGGRALIVLDRRMATGIEWTDGRFPTLLGRVSQAPNRLERDAALSRGTLRLTQTEKTGNRGSQSRGLIELWLELQPSLTIEGDWDLVDGGFSLYDSSFSSNPGGGGFRAWATQVIRRFVMTWGAPDLELRLKKNKSASPSYLHRVDDSRLRKYFDRETEGESNVNDLENIKAILADHPDDPYLLLHLIDLEARHGDLEKAEELMMEWRDQHWEQADPVLKDSASIAFKSVVHAKGLPEGDDLYAINQRLIAGESDLQSRLELLKSFLRYHTAITETEPLVFPSLQHFAEIRTTPMFLDFQVNARVAKTQASLNLFDGKAMDSFEILAGLFNQGRIMNANGTLIQRLIGIAIQLIAADGLELCLLNAIQTEEEMTHCLQILNQLEDLAGKETGETLFEGEWPPPLSFMDWTAGIGSPNDLEVEVRHHVGETYLDLLRGIAAARLHVMRTGECPSSMEELTQDFGGRPPKDRFGGDDLSISQSEGGDWTLYSYGPDEIDNQGSFDYSPTNGSKSSGDILMRVSPNREYPFPTGPVRAKNATEVLEQFPNGLPNDLFAITVSRQIRNLKYGIYEPTGFHPQRIFSRGPDGIEPHSYQSIVYYEMPGMNPVGPDDPGLPTRQPVYYPPTQPDGAPILYDPLVPYEPTNGTKSVGELFVKIKGD